MNLLPTGYVKSAFVTKVLSDLETFLTHSQTHFVVSRLTYFVEFRIGKVLITALAMTLKTAKFLIFMRIWVIVIQASGPLSFTKLVHRILTQVLPELSSNPASIETYSFDGTFFD